MKILFAGTPEIAVPSLRAIQQEFGLVAVLSAQDKVKGRSRRVAVPAVKMAAESLGVPVFQPETLGRQIREKILPLCADLLVVFAYGRIFGPKFLSLFPLGGINMHPSDLPCFRGPSPITAAILAGNDTVALTVQRVALEMDSGDILRQKFLSLHGRETTASLSDLVAKMAADELVHAIHEIASGKAKGMAQNHDSATYCALVKKEDGWIDWKKPAIEIERMVRAYISWPKAQTTLSDNRLFILEADVFNPARKKADVPRIVYNSEPACCLGVDKNQGILIQTGKGILAVTRLQIATKKPMDFLSFLNGVDLKVGMKLGGSARC